MNFNNVYIHVPFCRKKCDYCDFYSIESPSSELIKDFLFKLQKDLEALSLSRPVKSIYLGGGTPSLLNPTQIGELSKIVKNSVPTDSLTEISMECNPQSITGEKIAVIDGFVNRLSLGVQSFSEKQRLSIGRRSTQADLNNALSLIGEFAPSHFNIDLIYDIPGQTMTQWRDDLEKAVACEADHISCYALTIEPNTPLANRAVALDSCSDELSVAMWQEAETVLKSKGLYRYEISNYAKPNAECRHNFDIWHGGAYAGVGPAAASFDGTMRWTQVADISKWLLGASCEKDIIEPEARLMEIFVVGLRTSRGWDPHTWQNISLQSTKSMEWSNVVERIKKIKQQHSNLLQITPSNIKLTDTGMMFWNTIAEACLS